MTVLWLCVLSALLGHACAQAPYRTILRRVATALPSTDESLVDFAIAQDNLDLYIFVRRGESNFTEIHILTSASSYQNYSKKAVTPFTSTVGWRYSFSLAANRDVYVFIKSDNGEPTAEFHVLTSPDYRGVFCPYWSAHCGISIPPVADAKEFLTVKYIVAENGNVFYLVLTTTGLGISTLSATSHYRSFALANYWSQVPSQGNNLDTAVASNNDVYLFLNGSSHLGLKIFSASSAYRSQITLLTALQEHNTNIGSRFSFTLGPNRDIYAIKRNGTTSNLTELIVLRGPYPFVCIKDSSTCPIDAPWCQRASSQCKECDGSCFTVGNMGPVDNKCPMACCDYLGGTDGSNLLWAPCDRNPLTTYTASWSTSVSNDFTACEMTWSSAATDDNMTRRIFRLSCPGLQTIYSNCQNADNDLVNSKERLQSVLVNIYYEGRNDASRPLKTFTGCINSDDKLNVNLVIAVTLGSVLMILTLLVKAGLRPRIDTEKGTEDKHDPMRPSFLQVPDHIEYTDPTREFECAICLEPWMNPTELDCGHIFCDGCIISALQGPTAKPNHCPTCRQSFSKKKAPNRLILNMMGALKMSCKKCGWAGSREQAVAHECPPPRTEEETVPGTAEGLEAPLLHNISPDDDVDSQPRRVLAAPLSSNLDVAIPALAPPLRNDTPSNDDRPNNAPQHRQIRLHDSDDDVTFYDVPPPRPVVTVSSQGRGGAGAQKRSAYDPLLDPSL